MTLDEIGNVLQIAAAFDNRTVGEADVIAWGAALNNVTFLDAKAAVVEHYQRSTDRVMPAHVVIIAKRLVKERFENTPEPIPPAEIVDDIPAYLEWKQEVRRQIKAGTYVPPEPPKLVKRDLRALAESFKPPVDEPAELVDTVDETPGEETGQGKAA